jgi:hypothetical protein
MNQNLRTTQFQLKPSLTCYGALGARHDFLLCCSFNVLPICLSPLLEEKSHLAIKCEGFGLRFERSSNE